ncbi:MAG: stage III sporulation protein AF [Ruminococcus sp.]|nr:stage III sporulation protein AF [Ruminococcus sp.]
MNTLNTAATTLCVCCIVCSLFSMLIPQERTKKTLNLVLSLFLICSLILPVKTLLSDISVDLEIEDAVGDYSFTQEDYDRMVMKQTADNLVLCADNLLQNEGIKAENIRLSLKISEQGSIYVSNIIIYISEDLENRKQDIEAVIYRNFSKEPKIIVEER